MWKKMLSSQYVTMGAARARERSGMPDMRGGSGLSEYEGKGGRESAVKFVDAMLARAVVLNSVESCARGALLALIYGQGTG